MTIAKKRLLTYLTESNKDKKDIYDGIIMLAGCISTGKDILASQVLGADYAYVGTRFIATKEAPVHENVKKAILAASELDTRLVMRPIRNTERVLNNTAVERILEKEKELGSHIKFEDIIKHTEKLEKLVERWILDPSSFIGPDGDINNLFFQRET